METSFRFGLTRLEIAVLSAIAGVVAVLLSGIDEKMVADGQVELVLHRTGESPTDVEQSVIVVPRDESTVKQLMAERTLAGIWRDVPKEENPYRIESGFSYQPKLSVWGTLEASKTVPRSLLVQYLQGNQAPRYRLIPFEIPIGERRVELTMPSDPPSDTESWMSADRLSASDLPTHYSQPTNNHQ